MTKIELIFHLDKTNSSNNETSNIDRTSLTSMKPRGEISVPEGFVFLAKYEVSDVMLLRLRYRHTGQATSICQGKDTS